MSVQDEINQLTDTKLLDLVEQELSNKEVVFDDTNEDGDGNITHLSYVPYQRIFKETDEYFNDYASEVDITDYMIYPIGIVHYLRGDNLKDSSLKGNLKESLRGILEDFLQSLSSFESDKYLNRVNGEYLMSGKMVWVPYGIQ